jgi:hypothetical protein
MPLLRCVLGPGFAPCSRPTTTRLADRRLPALAVVTILAIGSLTSGSVARAGGGPENLFLVVNPTSPDSLAVANAFATLRQVPPINVFMLPWSGGDESTTIGKFREEILMPILRGIDARRLSPQIDCIVYAPGFPWRIDYAAELLPEVKADDRFPSGSLTGMTTLYAAVQSGVPAWLAADSNRYYRPVSADGVPVSTIGFRSWYGWGPTGELLEAGGVRYLLSVMLGVTAGRGNSVDEIIACLRSAARADGTRPPGTMYFMTNSDIRTTTRSAAFPGVVRALEELGVEAEIASGTLPVRKRNVAGLMAGTPNFDWRATASTIVPGAICENLTSFGGIFTPSAGQTPLSEFIRAGAAGSSGTVTEPFSLQAKFPHPSLQVHYARGASLAEAFYQSVQAPYQLIVVGDPLCQPWATIPEVEVVDAAHGTPLEPGQRLAGRIELEPRASRPTGSSGLAAADTGPPADRFELFVDGIRVAQASLGERLPLDTTELADGHHEIRVVAIAATPVATQGRRIIPVNVGNHDDGRGLQLVVEPQQVPVDGMLRIGVRGSGIDGAVIFSRGRVIGRTSLPEETIEVPAELLGRGSVVLRATGRSGPSPADAVNATPVTVNVTGGR